MESDGITLSDPTWVIALPKLSTWKCQMFGMGNLGITFRPLEGTEPNWFWRKMQYLVFGHKWIKED